MRHTTVGMIAANGREINGGEWLSYRTYTVGFAGLDLGTVYQLAISDFADADGKVMVLRTTQFTTVAPTDAEAVAGVVESLLWDSIRAENLLRHRRSKVVESLTFIHNLLHDEAAERETADGVSEGCIERVEGVLQLFIEEHAVLPCLQWVF